MQRFGGLEGVRAWMAWIVVFSHILSFTGFSRLTPWLAKPLAQLADGAVMVFTILSGFVITHLILTRRETYRQYIVRRFLRIYPVYLVALVAGIGGTFLAFDTFLGHPWGDLSPPTARLLKQAESLARGDFGWHLAAHLSMLHGAVSSRVLYEAQYMFLGPAWSLSLEWQFYLIAPLAVAMAAHRLGQVALVALGWWAYALYLQGVFGGFMLPSILPGAGLYLGVGIATRLLLGPRALMSSFPLALLMLGMALMGSFRAVWPVLFWGAFVCMMWLSPQASDVVSRAARQVFNAGFESPALKWLGARSYSTYLIHMPIVQLIAWVCVKLLNLGSVPTFIAVLLASVPMILLVSALLYRYVELPGIELGRSLASPWRGGESMPVADQGDSRVGVNR